MKRAIVFLAVLVLALSIVIAENDTEGKANETKNQTGPVMEQNGTLVQIGLANALTNVKNENARARIQANMQRFLEKYQERLQKMENVTVEVNEQTEETTVKGKEDVRFLGFIKGKATKRFDIDNNGKVTEKQPWYKFLYAEEQQ
jgi:hypothetical protein